MTRSSLLLAIAIAGAACGRPSIGSTRPGGLATGEGAGEAAAPTASSLEGMYACVHEIDGAIASRHTCQIFETHDGLMLRCDAAGPRLAGRVTPTEAGFHLVGLRLDERQMSDSLEVDFFQQGRQTYSTVIPLRDGQLLNIDLTRRSR